MQIKHYFFFLIISMAFVTSCNKILMNSRADWLTDCVNCSANSQFDPEEIIKITDAPEIPTHGPEEHTEPEDMQMEPEDLPGEKPCKKNEDDYVDTSPDEDSADDYVDEEPKGGKKCEVSPDIEEKKIMICHFDGKGVGRKIIISVNAVCPHITNHNDCIFKTPVRDVEMNDLYRPCSISDCEVNDLNTVL